MSKHNNPSISERARRIFNNQLNQEISNEVSDFIQPVIEIYPKTTYVGGLVATNASSTTIFTTPADKDFYLTGIQLSTIKDVTATSTYSRVQAYINGNLSSLCRIAGLSLTVQDQTAYSDFQRCPIKIDRNTAISIVHSTNVANVSSSVIIFGYFEEVKNPSLT